MRTRSVGRTWFATGLLGIALLAMLRIDAPPAFADENLPGTPQAQAAVTLIIEGHGGGKPPLDFIIADLGEASGGGGWDGGIQYLFSPPPELPISGAIAEVIEVEGPDGTQEETHLWVRPQGEQEPYASLDEAVVLSGTARSTEGGEGLPLEFAFHTGWGDPAGRYTLLVALRPLEATPAGAGGHGDAQSAASRPGEAITPEIIRLQADVPELIAVSLSSGEVDFIVAPDAQAGPASNEVLVTVSTNARKWALRCLAEPLAGPSGASVAGRLEWSRAESEAGPAARGPLSGETVILTGDRPVEKLEVPLRVTLRAQPGDPAGQYRGRLSVVGVVGA